jgi:hypothetical protein
MSKGNDVNECPLLCETIFASNGQLREMNAFQRCQSLGRKMRLNLVSSKMYSDCVVVFTLLAMRKSFGFESFRFGKPLSCRLNIGSLGTKGIYYTQVILCAVRYGDLSISNPKTVQAPGCLALHMLIA